MRAVAESMKALAAMVAGENTGVRRYTMNNLKPCPFCGGLAHIKRDIHTIAMGDGHDV